MQGHLKLVSNSDEATREDHSKERAHKAFESMEKQRLKQKLLIGAGLGSAGIAGIGAWKGNKALAGTGLSAAFISGLMHGKAKREESVAKHKIKKHLGMKKEAVVFSTAHGILHLVSPETAHMIPPTATAALDLLSIPYLAKMLGKSSLKNIGIMAKKTLGMSLTKGDKIQSGLMETITSAEDLARKAHVPKSVVDYASSYGSSLSTGKKYGPIAGKVVEEISDVSPKYKKPLMDFMLSGGQSEDLKNLFNKDKTSASEAYQKAKGTLSYKILKKLKPEFGEGKHHIDPANFPGYVEDIKEFEKKFMQAGAGVGAGLGAGILGSYIGNKNRLKRLDTNLDQIISDQ